MAGGRARLLKQAGFGGDDGRSTSSQFAGALYASQYNRVVYHESHDEAGNAGGTARTLRVAVNGAPLIGATRDVRRGPCRVAFGLSLLSAGTPMFFMGEEVGAQKPYTLRHFMANREDIAGQRAGSGAQLFRFYQDLIRFSRQHPAIRAQSHRHHPRQRRRRA